MKNFGYKRKQLVYNVIFILLNLFLLIKIIDGPTIFGSLCNPLSDVHKTAATEEGQKFIIKSWNKVINTKYMDLSHH